MLEGGKAKLSRLVITCGGTGGHFYPGLSIAVAAQQRGIDVLLLLSGVNSAAQSKLAESAGIRAVVLPPMPHPGSPIRAWRFVRGAVGGWIKAAKCLKSFQPQAVLGMGSFAMTPVLLAAKKRGIPIFLHDGNTVIGKANRIFSRFAKFVGCAYPPVNHRLIYSPWKLVGMPVRQALREQSGITKQQAMEALNRHYGAGFDPEVTTLLVTGGSQGAASFNRIFPRLFRALKLYPACQVLHLCGKGKRDEAAAFYEGFAGKLLLLESSEHMEWFFGAADLVFSRAGGSTLAEITLFGKPAVLIPYPYAAEDHQRHNAQWFVEIGAGAMIESSDFSDDTPEKLKKLESRMREIFLFSHLDRQAEASLRAARPDAAEKMLDLIENHL